MISQQSVFNRYLQSWSHLLHQLDTLSCEEISVEEISFLCLHLVSATSAYFFCCHGKNGSEAVGLIRLGVLHQIPSQMYMIFWNKLCLFPKVQTMNLISWNLQYVCYFVAAFRSISCNRKVQFSVRCEVIVSWEIG